MNATSRRTGLEGHSGVDTGLSALKCSPEKTVLDLGCGANKVPGATGMDICSLPGVDVIHDLNCFPYPFPADSVDEIHLNHVLEHVPDVMATMEELWRISKPGGIVHIRVPHFTGILAWKDPTHRRSFTSESFGYFGDNGFSYYTRARFKVVSVSLRYFVDAERGWIYRNLAKAVQWLFDRHPTLGERHLAYLVGGIDEIEFTLKTEKAVS